nr:MAG TPA: hypothetical protein [Caudoviricetes sp.]
MLLTIKQLVVYECKGSHFLLNLQIFSKKLLADYD